MQITPYHTFSRVNGIMIKIATIQLNSSASIGTNVITCQSEIKAAVDANNQCIILPDHFSYLSNDPQKYPVIREQFGNGRIQNFIQEAAQEHGIYIVTGSIPTFHTEDDSKTYLTHFIYNPKGECIHYYHQRHFQTPLAASLFTAGQTLNTVPLPFAELIVICAKDLFHPMSLQHIFSKTNLTNTRIIAVSGAFGSRENADLWQPLLQIRALDNQAYIFAANQTGYHLQDASIHYGNTCIVTPDGNIAKLLSVQPGFIDHTLKG